MDWCLNGILGQIQHLKPINIVFYFSFYYVIKGQRISHILIKRKFTRKYKTIHLLCPEPLEVSQV